MSGEHVTAVPPREQQRRRRHGDQRRHDAPLAEKIHQRDARDGAQRRAEHRDLRDGRNAPQTLQQRAQGGGDDADQDRQREESDPAIVFRRTEAELRHRRREQQQEQAAEAAAGDAGAPQHDDRPRDPRLVARRGRIGNFAHAARVDAELREGAREVGDQQVGAEQAIAGRAEQHRHRLCADDADGDGQ